MGNSLLNKWLMAVKLVQLYGASPKVQIGIRLLDHLNVKTGQCNPSFRELAKAGGVDRRTAMRAVQTFKGDGLIRAFNVGGGNNSYEWIWERLGTGGDAGDTTPVSRQSPRGDTADTTPSDRRDIPPGDFRDTEENKEGVLNGEIGNREGKPSSSDDANPFERWWGLYPRKTGKREAQQIYERLIRKGEATHEELLLGVMRYAAERQGQETRFTKHPGTWLNKGCWADDPAPPQAQTLNPTHRGSRPVVEAILNTSTTARRRAS
jgi:hypothetical protein